METVRQLEKGRNKADRPALETMETRTKEEEAPQTAVFNPEES